MRRWIRPSLGVLMLLLLLTSTAWSAPPEAEEPDLAPRLQEIYRLRAQALLTGTTAPPVDADYLPGARKARWALNHEHGKLRYVRQWAENRGVRFVEANPTLRIKLISKRSGRMRYYVAQSLQLGYSYPGEEQVNRFGVGTRHIIELQEQDGRWLIASEWYSDPLGDDTEVPDVTPALIPAPLPGGVRPDHPAAGKARKGYDREGAVRYVDKYCGQAWGCGNDNRYNPRYRNFTGLGGDCTNFVTQALIKGGGLRVPIIPRVSTLVGYLRSTGRGAVVARGPFQAVWKQALANPRGFEALLGPGDLVAYQEKGKFEHFAMVTGFDTHGYPLVNSHTADRYHVPFDLGWDRRTVYWLFRIRN